MKLKTLKIKGFKSYLNQVEIDFSKFPANEIFLIVGKTGSGKSTILDAITFALFGKQFKEKKAASYDFLNASYIREFTENKLTANKVLSEVELSFEYSDGEHTNEYTVIRKISTKNSKISGNGKLSDFLQDKHVILKNGKECKNLPITMDIDHFKKMVIIPQNKFSDFLTMKGEEKAEFLSKIFHLEKYRAIKDILKEEVKTLDQDVENIIKKANDILKRLAIQKEVVGTGINEDIFRDINEKKENIERELIRLDEEIKKYEHEKKKIEEKENHLKNVKKLWDEYTSLEQELGRLKEKSSEIQEKKEKWEKANKVADLYEKLKKISELQKKLENLNSKIKATKKQLAELNKEKEKLETEKQDLEKRQDEQENKKHELQRLQEIIERFPEYKKEKENIKSLESEKKKKEEEINEKEENLKEINNRLNQIEGKLDLLFKAHLAKKLKENEPCPVCGSTEHPAPFGLDEDGDPEQILQERKQLLEKKEKLVSIINTKQNEIKDIVDKLNVAAIKVAGIEQNIKKSLGKDDTEDIKQIEAEIQEKIQKISEEIHIYDEQKKQWEKKNKEVETKIAKTQGQLNEMQDECGKIEKQLSEEKVKFSEELGARKLQEEEVNEYYIDYRERDKLDREIREYEDKKNKFEGQKQSLEKKLEKDDPDLLKKEKSPAQLEEEIMQVEQKKKELIDAINRNNQEKGRLESEKEKIEKEEEEFRKTVEDLREKGKKFQIKKFLLKILEGETDDTNIRLSFDRYILHVYFQTVVANANERLKTINNRYRLVSTIEKETVHDKKVGLGLEIFDSYMGTLRPTLDLSGGETFYVSLSLALGLNDLYHQKHAGQSIDFLFIDEGFGSLDEETLDSVITTLKKFFTNNQYSKKQLGLISHVESMKKRFPYQIVVENNNGISSVTVKT